MGFFERNCSKNTNKTTQNLSFQNRDLEVYISHRCGYTDILRFPLDFMGFFEKSSSKNPNKTHQNLSFQNRGLEVHISHRCGYTDILRFSLDFMGFFVEKLRNTLSLNTRHLHISLPTLTNFHNSILAYLYLSLHTSNTRSL